MINESQCQTHTRTPWGTSSHIYPPRLRNTFIALAVFLFFGLLITAVIFIILSIVSEETQPPTSTASIPAEHDTSPMLLHERAYVADIATQDEYFPPFNECGDQFHGCERYYKPVSWRKPHLLTWFFLYIIYLTLKQNFCCPFGNICFASTLSPSGVYCCGDPSKCIVSESHIPSCIAGTVACEHSMGGGCCPAGMTCSPDGCLAVEAIDDHPKFQYPDNPDPFSQLPTMSVDLLSPATTVEDIGADVAVDKAIPQATYTEVKIAEMAEVSAASRLGMGICAQILAIIAFMVMIMEHRA